MVFVKFLGLLWASEDEWKVELTDPDDDLNCQKSVCDETNDSMGRFYLPYMISLVDEDDNCCSDERDGGYGVEGGVSVRSLDFLFMRSCRLKNEDSLRQG